jgi:hypothetical protein
MDKYYNVRYVNSLLPDFHTSCLLIFESLYMFKIAKSAVLMCTERPGIKRSSPSVLEDFFCHQLYDLRF